MQYFVTILKHSKIVIQNETEWQSFIRQNLEFVGKVSELFPLDVLRMIVSLSNGCSPEFGSCSKVYMYLILYSTSQFILVRDTLIFLAHLYYYAC